MIARTTPYDLTPFRTELDSLVAKVTSGVPPAATQIAIAAEVRDLLEIIAASAFDAPRTGSSPWGAQYDGARLLVTGGRVMMVGCFAGGTIASVLVDTGTRTWEADYGATAVRVRMSGPAGVISHFTFGADGSVRDERESATMLREPAAHVPPPAAARPVAAQPPVPEQQWYYVKSGQTLGPVAETELRGLLALLPPDTLVWNQDLGAWKKAADAGLLAPPPPPVVLPPPPPPPPPAPVLWELAVQAGPSAGKRYLLSENTRIGRNPDCDIVLPDGLVSRLHAEVRKQPDGYWIADNRSLNGTVVNGARIQDPVRLAAGDVVTIGECDLVFQAESAAGAAPEGPR